MPELPAPPRFRWRLRSMATVGFRIDPWCWFASASGVVVAVFLLDPRTWALDLTSGPGWATISEKLIVASVGCFVWPLVCSYVAWKWRKKSPDAATVGWIVGVLVAVGFAAYSLIWNERDRERAGPGRLPVYGHVATATPDRERTPTTVSSPSQRVGRLFNSAS